MVEVTAENVDCNGRVDQVVVTSEVSTRFPLVNTSLTMYKQSSYLIAALDHPLKCNGIVFKFLFNSADPH